MKQQNKSKLQIHNPFYLSRSMLETFGKCPRRGYYNYLYDGRGLTNDVTSLPLTTGTIIHEGIGYLFNCILQGKLSILSTAQVIIDRVNEAVDYACKLYAKELEVATVGTTKQTFHVDHLDFLKKEQIGITEGLIRAWAFQELPIILKRYVVVSAEKSEVNAIMLWNGIPIILQTRADAVLKKKDSKDTFVYSLKTIKKFSDWDLKSYARGTQVYTEMFGVDNWLERYEREKTQKLGELARTYKTVTDASNKEAIKKRFDTLKGEHISKVSMGVRFCYLVKGDRKEEIKEDGTKTGKWITYNPFIRGYKKINISSIDYASSWITTKVNNKSGYGTLGKGWEPFYVWDEGLTVRNWMRMIKAGKVQPLDRNIIKEHVVVPAEVFRNQSRQEEVLSQVREDASTGILSKMKRCIDYGLDPETIFTQTLTACVYPSECEYLAICDRREVKENPEMFGYGYRIPHHAAELVQIKGLGKI